MKNGSSIIVHSFNGGEVSPYIRYRSDLSKYPNCSSELTNFFITPQGAVTRRTGTKCVCDVTDLGDDIRVIPFEFNNDQAYVVLFYKKDKKTYVRIYDRDGVLKTKEDILTNYEDIDLKLLQYIQSYDVLFFSHPSDFPQTLSRYGDENWVWDKYNIKVFPSLPTEEDGVATISFEDWNSLTYEDGTPVEQYSTPTFYNKEKEYPSGSFIYNTESASINGFSLSTETKTSGSDMRGRKYFQYKLVAKVELSSTIGFEVGDSIALAGISGYLNIGVTKNNVTQYAYVEPQVYTGIISKITSTSVYFYPTLKVTEYGDFDVTHNSNGIFVWSTSEPKLVNEFKVDTSASSINSSIPSAFYYAEQDVPANNTPEANSPYWSSREFFVGVINIEATKDTFTKNAIGEQLRFDFKSDHAIRGNFLKDQAGATSYCLSAYGIVSLKTEGGIWGGSIELQASYDNGISWETLGSIESNGNYNAEIERELVENALVRVFMADREEVDSDTGCKYILSSVGSICCYGTIVDVISPTKARVSLDSPITRAFSNAKIYKSAWGKEFGFPSSVEIYEERLFFGGTEREPHTIWGSSTNNWDNFQSGTLDTSSVSFELSIGTFDKITALHTIQHLLVFTDRGEWSIGSRGTGQALTGSNVFARKQSSYGSAKGFMAVSAEDYLMFVRADGKKVANISYDYNTEGYTSDDMSVLSEHLLKSGVKEVAQAMIPKSILWVLTNAGEVATFSFMPKQEVSGWSRQKFGDGVISLCMLRNAGVDEAFMVVKRGENRYIECYNPECDKYIDNWNKDVQIEYESVVHPLPFVIQKDVYGKTGIIKGLSLYFIESKGGEVSVDGGKTFESIAKYSGFSTTSIDGEIQMTLNSGWRNKFEVILRTKDKHPFNISAIGVYGNRTE